MVVMDRIFPLNNEVPAVPAVPMVVDGVEFRLSLLFTSGAPYLATQIAFVASERMDGGMLECETGSPLIIETLTLAYKLVNRGRGYSPSYEDCLPPFSIRFAL